MTSSFVEFMTHTVEAFQPDHSPSRRWDAANLHIKCLGGTALSIGAFNVDRAEPKWMLSSMSPVWLQKYADGRLFGGDLFIPKLKKQNTPIELDTRLRPTSQPLNAQLFKAGYKFLYGIPFQGVELTERKIFTYCTDLTSTEVKARGYLVRIRFLAAILATQLLPLDDTISASELYFPNNNLTAREVESLTLLAHGYRNQRIAETLGIAEVTVRKHINAARIKLGANTREQAIAIALQHRFIGQSIRSDI